MHFDTAQLTNLENLLNYPWNKSRGVFGNSISIGILVAFSLILFWTIIFGVLFTFLLVPPSEVHAANLPPPEASDLQLINQTLIRRTSNDVPPIITINEPISGSAIPWNSIMVNGSVTDPEGNLEKVELFINRYPFDGKYTFAFSQSIGNNSSTEGTASDRQNYNWSFPVRFDNSGVYRILAHAQDRAENHKWDEINIFIPFNSSADSYQLLPESQVGNINNDTTLGDNITKIAIVNPTFTDAAYGPNAFYIFYKKYDRSGIYDQYLPTEANVTTDLNMLTAKLDPRIWIDPHTPANLVKNMSMFSRIEPDNRQIGILVHHIENELLPNRSAVNVIRDEDVHNGYIFDANNRSNAYDIIILNHEEYLSQQMYDNYKKFVQNGGTMLLLDGNTFYAEVKYDPVNNTITLVKGHDWEYDFDKKVARPGPHERWFDENKEWVGSNFLLSDINENITFANNPFNYTHFEDNFVNNDNVSIIIDYRARIPASNAFSGATVATYELSVGKGKVIVIGIYGENLIKEYNKEFLKFLDYLLLKSVSDS